MKANECALYTDVESVDELSLEQGTKGLAVLKVVQFFVLLAYTGAAWAFVFVVLTDIVSMHHDWQVLQAGPGKAGEGGQRQAIEDIDQKGGSLLALAAPKAHLEGLNLARHKKRQWQPFDRDHLVLLLGADFTEANLRGANLSGANLKVTQFNKANLSRADLSDADFTETNLSGANLSNANLHNAYLLGVNLSGANLSGANLHNAYLSAAKLIATNMAGTELSGANLSSALLLGTALTNTQGLTLEQLEGTAAPSFPSFAPLLCRVKLPKGFPVKLSNRNCDAIVRLLLTEQYPERFKDLAAAQAYVDKLPKP